MFDEESLKKFRECVPSATIFGVIVGCAGIAMLIISKDALAAEFVRFNRSFVEKRDSCSLYKGDKKVILGAFSFVALSILVIVMGFLSNGEIRAKIFGSAKIRIVGVVLCALLGVLTFASIFWWLHDAEFYTRYFAFPEAVRYECVLADVRSNVLNIGFGGCMFMSLANIILDDGNYGDFSFCDVNDRFRICELLLPIFRLHFKKIFFSFCVIMIGHAIIASCIAADYVKIRCQAKFQELDDLRSLEIDIGSK